MELHTILNLPDVGEIFRENIEELFRKILQGKCRSR